MTQLIQSYQLSGLDWMLVLLCAAMIGMSKTGLSGIGLVVVPVLAGIFGGKPSVGLLLPILIFADVFAVGYYHRHADWKYVLKVMPWAIAGILAGVVVGRLVDDVLFKRLMAGVVMLGIGLMIWQDLRKKKVVIPDFWWFSMVLGLAGGFATMIGNAAGPVMAMYLLSMRLPKKTYIGTTAWFFFIVNLFKVPFHIFVWNTMDLHSIAFDVMMIPAIAVGAIGGFYLVRLFPEKAYRIFIIASTIGASLFLFK